VGSFHRPSKGGQPNRKPRDLPVLVDGVVPPPPGGGQPNRKPRDLPVSCLRRPSEALPSEACSGGRGRGGGRAQAGHLAGVPDAGHPGDRRTGGVHPRSGSPGQGAAPRPGPSMPAGPAAGVFRLRCPSGNGRRITSRRTERGVPPSTPGWEREAEHRARSRQLWGPGGRAERSASDCAHPPARRRGAVTVIRADARPAQAVAPAVSAAARSARRRPTRRMNTQARPTGRACVRPAGAPARVSPGGGPAFRQNPERREGERAGEGNRTPIASLGSSCSAIELHPRGSPMIAGLPQTRQSDGVSGGTDRGRRWVIRRNGATTSVADVVGSRGSPAGSQRTPVGGGRRGR
jgi:hypothetical protein